MTELRGLNYQNCGSDLELIDIETARMGDITIRLSPEDSYMGVGE